MREKGERVCERMRGMGGYYQIVRGMGEWCRRGEGRERVRDEGVNSEGSRSSEREDEGTL